MPTERTIQNALNTVLDLPNPSQNQLKEKQAELLQIQKSLEKEKVALEKQKKEVEKRAGSVLRLKTAGQRGQGLQVVE